MIVYHEKHEITLGDILNHHKLIIQNYENIRIRRCKISLVHMKEASR